MKMLVALALVLTTSMVLAKGKVRKITLVNYEIEGVKQWKPGFFAVTEGEQVELTLINKAKAEHGFRLSAAGVRKVVKKGQKEKVTFTAPKAGLYDMDCQLHPAHVGGQMLVVDK